MYASSSQGFGVEDPVTWKFYFGLNLFIRPDAGKLRFTLKPRYSLYDVAFSQNFNSGVFGGEWMESYKYTQYEIPFQLEFGIDREKEISYYMAVGYNPAYKSNYNFIYNDGNKSFSKIADSTGGLNHSIYAEGGFEGKRFRFSFGVYQQLGAVPGSNYSFNSNGNVIYPFREIDKFPLMFGIELSCRLKGIWGVKHKQAPSKFLNKRG